MNPIKLLIVDDHPMVRLGLKSLLEGVKDVTSIDEAIDGEDAMVKYEKGSYDVIIMDIKMPKKDGIEATQDILKKNPNARIIALSMMDEQDYIVKMLQAGAKGYLLKNSSRDELLKAVHAVSKGDNYFSHEVSSIMLAKFINKEYHSKNKPVKLDAELTKREKEIIKMIAEEMTNAEIGVKLGISIRTVDTHRRNLLQKLDVKNTAGLVRYAIQAGFLD
jgi:DNA-binding NarL/FixJ family response regulator